MSHASEPWSVWVSCGWPGIVSRERASVRQCAERVQVSTTTVQPWDRRYRQVLAEGTRPTAADMVDRSSRQGAARPAPRAK